MASSSPVPVPDRLSQPHPLVAALRDDKDRLGLTSSVRGRGLRILQALITAAEVDGYAVTPVAQRNMGYGPPRYETNDHFYINTGECRVGVRIVQETDKQPHEPTARELAEKKRYSWTRIPEYDHIPSERLRLEVDARYNGRQSKWADRQRWRLDDKLPALLEEVHARHVEAQERRLKAEAAAAAQERRREEALRQATSRYRESSKVDALLRQALDWQQATLLRAYLDAMQEVVDAMCAVEQERAREWLAWSQEYADRLDPLGRTVEPPCVPEPTPDQLRPFLREG
jgi:hypothetical protein